MADTSSKWKEEASEKKKEEEKEAATNSIIIEYSRNPENIELTGFTFPPLHILPLNSFSTDITLAGG